MERRLRSPHCRIQAQAVAELTTQIEQRLKATSSSLSLSECKQQLDMLWACLLAQVGNQDQGLAALACSALASLHNHYVTAPTLALSDAVARISAAAKTAPACNIPHVFGLISSIFTSAGACNPPPSASTSAAAAAAFQVDGTHRHPFILLLLTRPAESWSCVLHQIRQLILHPAGETAAAVEELEVHHLLSRFLWLEPVFIFVFLHRHSPSSSAAAAIYHFSNLKSGIIAVFRHILVIHHHHHHPLRLPVLSLILKLIRSDLIYSIDKCMGVFNELLSCVNCFLDGNQNGNLEVEISLVLLDAALHINTMIASNFLSSSYVLINGIIETIARIASSSSNSASTEWIIVTSFALSRLLISASAPQQQMLLMSIMDLLLSRESLTPIHPSAVCFMLLPLIQLDHLHNSQQQHPIIKKLTAVLRKVECVLKENVADRVENLSNLLDFSRPPFSSSSSTSPSSSPIITGPLASLISAVKLIHSGSNLCLNSLKFIERDLIVFVVAPILLGPDTKSRQAALSHLSKMDLQTTKSADSSSYSSSSALSLLSLYLYINNRFSQKEPETSRLIFTTSLPNLASPEDPFATSAVLKIILSMTDSGDRLVKRDIKLRPLAALALCNIWKRHGRIWDKLKSRFSDVLLRISRDDGDYLVYGEYKLTLLGIMRDLTLSKPALGPELLPYFTKYVDFWILNIGNTKEVSNLEWALLLLALQSINSCLKFNIASPRVLWNAIYVKLVNLLSNISVIPADILTQVCGYFALVGEKSEETEIEIAFRHEIIYNHLVPATNVLTVFTELIPDQKQQVSTTSTLTPATILYQVYKSSGCTDAPWAALSSFPPFDFFTCLPESPKVLVQQLAVSLEESVSESRKLTLNTLESFLHAGSIDAHAFPGQCRILASLITNEIKWMRRAVFKGLAADSGAVFLRQPRSLNRGVGDSDGQDVMMARKPLLDLIVKIVVDAVASLSGGGGGGGGGKTTSRSGAAGLGGGAVVPVKLLSTLALYLPYRSTPDVVAPDASVISPLIRLRLNQVLRDLPSISLADTLLQKMDGISGWAVFWKNAIGLQIHQTRSTSDRESIEKSIRCLFEECIGKFPDVKTPTSAVHLFNCMSGLLQTVGKYSQQVGWEMSAITVDLCSSTLKRTDSKSVLSELCSNSEVVKSAVICCFWVAVCAFDSTQGSTIASCLDILFEESLLYANSNGDDSLGESAHEVASFYANMGLMEVLSTFGSTLAPVHDRIFQHLTSVFSGGGGNSSIGLFSPQSDRFCGFLFGLGCKLTSISQSLLFAEDVSPNSSSLRLLLERLARLAIEWVKEAVLSTASTPPPMSLSAQRNIGAAVWVLVALLTSCSEDHCGTLIPNLNLSSTEFDSLIDAIQSLKKRSWDSDDLSALLACADMHILNCLADNDPDSLIKSHLLSNMRDSKSTLLVESPYLLGFPNLLSSETENIQASFSSLGDVLESLWSAVPEARSSRAASHVLGSIISYYLSYDSLVEGDDIPASQINAGLKIALEAQSLVITTSSSSSAFGTSQSAVDLPKDLRRLNTQSSFLKAVFDTLTLETKEPNIVFLLQSLMIVDHLLPVVDWSSTINHSLSKLASPLGIMSCYLFVAKNSHILSNKSFFTSLTKFVQTILKGGDVKLSNGALDWDLALASEFGIGRLLELGGLRKHDSIKSSAEGEIVLPSDFVQDICLKIYHEASAKKSERFADTIQAYLFADTNSDLGNRLRESVLLYFLNSPTSGISHVLASSYLSSFTGGDGSGAVMAVRNLLSHEVLSSNQDGCISSMQLYASVGLILHLHQQADQFDQNNKARIVELLSGQRANLPLSPLLQRTFVKVLQGVVCNSPARTRVPVHSIFTSVVQYCQHQANSSFEDKMDLVIALLDLILLNSALLNSRTQGDRVIHSPQALWRFVIAPAVSSLWASMEQYHGKDAEIISDFLIDYSFARLTNLVFLNIWCHKQDSVEERVGTILKQFEKRIRKIDSLLGTSNESSSFTASIRSILLLRQDSDTLNDDDDYLIM